MVNEHCHGAGRHCSADPASAMDSTQGALPACRRFGFRSTSVMTFYIILGLRQKQPYPHRSRHRGNPRKIFPTRHNVSFRSRRPKGVVRPQGGNNKHVFPNHCCQKERRDRSAKKEPLAGGAGTYEGRCCEGIPSRKFDYRQKAGQAQPRFRVKCQIFICE